MSLSEYMKQKNLVAFSLSICLVVFCPFQCVHARSGIDSDVIDSFIAKQKKKEKAVEHKDARTIMRGDLNGDGKEDVVALYTLEGFRGTNLYLQYIAIFIRDSGNLRRVTHQIVGGKNRRAVELKSVVNGEINLDTQEYLPKDASCCPSKKGNIRFSIIRGKLKEIETEDSAKIEG